MKLFLFDLETSGIDVNTVRILEHGFIIWDTSYKKPVSMGSAIWWDIGYPLEWKEAEKVNGISPEYAKKFGNAPSIMLEALESLISQCDYMVAHNGKSYDLPLLQAEAKRHGNYPSIMSKPIIDTKELPYAHAPRSKHLGHLAYDLRVFHDPAEKHSALFDCQLMLGILKSFDIEYVIKCASAKSVTLLAHCDYHTKELAKSGGYSWVDKKWQKQVKDFELEAEREKAKRIGFDVSVC